MNSGALTHTRERERERVIECERERERERERDVWRRKLRAGKLRMRHNDREP